MQLLIPACLTLLAVIVIAIGRRFARDAKHPARFRLGSVLAAVGFMLLWLLPWAAIEADAGAWAMPLMVAALVVAISVLGGGLATMASASTGQGASRVDDHLHDLARLNDWP